jgi:hypothetical protein
LQSNDHYPNAKSKQVKSKCYNIQVSYSSYGDLLELFDGLKIIELKLAMDDYELNKVYL